MTATWPPVEPLLPDVAGAVPWLNRVIAFERDASVNAEGGDVGGFGSSLLVARHVANYQAAVEAVRRLGAPPGHVLDVGCGVGALSAWSADALGRDLVLCDRDAAVVAVGGAAFEVPTTTDLADAPAAPVVLAMEVLEHVPPGDQRGFAEAVWDKVARGGLLVVSTPDETSWPGGWSGYPPHVGCVTPRQLHHLLSGVTGTRIDVHRLEGGPFRLPAARRWLERVANGAWQVLQSRLPATSERLAGRSSRHDPLDPTVTAAAARPFRIIDARHGHDTGLLAVVRRP